jgi:trimethylamine:corrinoid methyltransferase-like protein
LYNQFRGGYPQVKRYTERVKRTYQTTHRPNASNCGGIFIKPENFFTESQMEQIRAGAVSILNEIGVKVGRPHLVERLARLGFRTHGNFVRVEPAMARAKMESQKPEGPAGPEGPTEPAPPAPLPKHTLTTYTSAYSHMYENLDGTFAPITTAGNLAMGVFVANTAKLWPNLGVACPGHPTDVPPDAQFLRQAVNGFLCREGFVPMEPVSLKTTDFYFALCETMGCPVRGLPIYVASPLNISGESFDIALEYHQRLKDVYFCSMPSLGANTPLNLVAAYAQTAAESIGGAVLFEALTGVRAYYGTNLFTFDFRDMAMPFGTPEKLLLEWTNTEVAARLPGGEYLGQFATDIHTNAPRCGIQACAEKASLATAGALLGAVSFGCSGTLAMDELFSPVQLLLDLEILQHAEKIAQGMPKEDFDGDLLEEVRQGLQSGYIMADRTLDNLDRYVWPARFFNRKTFGTYLAQPFKTEVEKAADLAADLLKAPPSWHLDDLRAKEVEGIFAAALDSLT